jgi:ATP-dependent RNA helicase DeaD
MTAADIEGTLGPDLSAALAKKGYLELTAVQEAVLDPALAGRDLRITSQTGSGKTLAFGFVLRDLVREACPAQKGIARPRGLIVAPTRELAKQVEDELTWFYAGVEGRVASATGGASYRDEHRGFAKGPAVIVGTPGRLLDHIERGAVDVSGVSTIVLDEADRMLDLGFREELEAILGRLPNDHRTHLCSATFPRDVRALADRVQKKAAHVEGTRLGKANTDIDHVIHLVDPRRKVDAIINLLLSSPEAQTLVFARTRADVGGISSELSEAGFRVSSLSGEMEQAARNRALASFKRGDLHVLVATDVAARGIDVQDIARVIHVDAPTNADSYTHRSGRTGRAGRRGTSSLLVAPTGVRQAERILRLVGVPYRFEPIPSADEIQHAADERIVQELTRPATYDAPSVDERTQALAARIVEAGDPTLVIGRLLQKAGVGGAAKPREVRSISPSAPAPGPRRGGDRGGGRDSGGERSGPRETHAGMVAFRVSWGAEQGADPRRLTAMVCRRGGIRGSDLGAIFVERNHSVVNVATRVAESFAREAAKPDPRDPRVRIEVVRAERERSERPAAPRAPSAPKHARPAPPEPRAPSAPKHAAPSPASAPRHARPSRPEPHASHAPPASRTKHAIPKRPVIVEAGPRPRRDERRPSRPEKPPKHRRH